MLQNNCEFRVLVKGKPITEFAHQNQIFVEGRDGSNFELEFINRTPGRVEAVISVDGLSVMDGKTADVQKSVGYVLNAGQTIRIPGWRLTGSEVARFEFAGKSQSYAVQAGGDPNNVGVIGVVVYAEKLTHQYQYSPWVYNHLNLPFGTWPIMSNTVWNTTYDSSMPSTTSTNPWVSVSKTNPWVSVSNITDTLIGGGDTSASLGATGSDVAQGVCMNGIQNPAMTARNQSSSVLEPMKGSRTTAPIVQTLGTGFGEVTQFKTVMVSLERGGLSTTLLVYYDNLDGLKQRGIKIERRNRRPMQTQPQAFPGVACQPPANWHRC